MSHRAAGIGRSTSDRTAVQSAGTKFNISAHIDIKEDISHLPELSYEMVADIIRRHFAGQLGEEQLNAIIESPEVMEKLVPAAAILDSPALRENYDVRIDTSSAQERAGIKISITRKIYFHDGAGDFPAPKSEQKDVAYISVVVLSEFPAKRAKKKVKRKKAEEAPAAAPVDEYAGAPKADFARICRPGDRACWQRQIELFGSVPNLAGCGKYIDEQNEFTANMGDLRDPLLPRKMTLAEALANPPPPPDVNDGGREFYEIFIHPQVAEISKPSGKCMTEWNDTFEVVPTLGCTKEYADFDKAANSSLATIVDQPWYSPLPGIVQMIPGLSNYMAYRSRQVVNGEAYKTIWAMRWMDRVKEKLEKGDYDYVDKALNSVAQDYREMRILRTFMRQWHNDKGVGYHETTLFIYKEYFLWIYPEMADTNGMPDFTKFKVKLWWATNWLSMVKRGGMSLSAALDMLRCTASWDVAAATLRELLPYLKSTGRFRDIARDLERLLAGSPPS